MSPYFRAGENISSWRGRILPGGEYSFTAGSHFGLFSTPIGRSQAASQNATESDHQTNLNTVFPSLSNRVTLIVAYRIVTQVVGVRVS
jgi:hypothetical protein